MKYICEGNKHYIQLNVGYRFEEYHNTNLHYMFDYYPGVGGWSTTNACDFWLTHCIGRRGIFWEIQPMNGYAFRIWFLHKIYADTFIEKAGEVMPPFNQNLTYSEINDSFPHIISFDDFYESNLLVRKQTSKSYVKCWHYCKDSRALIDNSFPTWQPPNEVIEWAESNIGARGAVWDYSFKNYPTHYTFQLKFKSKIHAVLFKLKWS